MTILINNAPCAAQDRRAFIVRSFATGMAISLTGFTSSCMKKDKDEKEEETTPNEDLMREHGLLDRVLLIYEENIKKPKKLDGNIIHSSAKIIQDFIENYHEKLEEEYLFPILEKDPKYVDLIATLKKQHEVGRQITNTILRLSNSQNPQDITLLEQNLSTFITMYRAHAAREDTVAFPAFKAAISEHRYKELGEIFEDREHKLFGKEGFEGVLKKVENLEKEIGISELNHYTPKIS